MAESSSSGDVSEFEARMRAWEAEQEAIQSLGPRPGEDDVEITFEDPAPGKAWRVLSLCLARGRGDPGATQKGVGVPGTLGRAG